MKLKLKNVIATAMSCIFLFFLVIGDGQLAYALSKPATPNLQHNNWSGDPSYEITMNMWWGENGDSWKLYENGKLIHEEKLINKSPNQQSASFKVNNNAKGTYSYYCELINSGGVSTSGTINVTVTKGETTVIKPGIPTGLIGASLGENLINVKWNGVNTATSYDLEVDGNIVNVTTLEYSHSGLKADSEHSYRVRAKNSAGTSDWSNLISVKTDKEKPPVTVKPEIPKNLTGKASNSNAINLTWDVALNADSYELEVDKTVVKVNGLNYEHKGLIAESTHNYRVRAINVNGSSEWSNLITVTTPKVPEPPKPGEDGLPEKVLVGYWHNFDNGSTKTALKDTSLNFDLIDVAFAESLSDQATMIFEPYNNTEEGFKKEVEYLQSKGKKVIISIGGQNGRLHLDTKAKEDAFVNSMIAMIEKYGFNGMDIDLEGGAVSLDPGDTDVNNPKTPKVVNLISATKRIRAHFGNGFILTMAPEVTYVQGGLIAYAGPWGAYLPVINGLRDELTLLHVQHYNHGSQEALDGNTYAQGTADFQVSMAEMMITGFEVGRGTGNFFKGLPAEKVAIGLPSCSSAAGGGYTQESEVIKALDYLINGKDFGGKYKLRNPEGYKKFRGVMTWSTNWDETTGFKFSNAYRQYFNSLK
ncbi:MAG: glycosyl hydrolase family 18 protein [Sarcina sp.]